jgi:hypothetical protein
MDMICIVIYIVYMAGILNCIWRISVTKEVVTVTRFTIY